MGDSFICNRDGTWTLNPGERIFCTAPGCGWRGKLGDVVDSIIDPKTQRPWRLCPLCRTPAHIDFACETPGCWKTGRYEYFTQRKCWTVCGIGSG
jgi:hypothetical protein